MLKYFSERQGCEDCYLAIYYNIEQNRDVVYDILIENEFINITDECSGSPVSFIPADVVMAVALEHSKKFSPRINEENLQEEVKTDADYFPKEYFTVTPQSKLPYSSDNESWPDWKGILDRADHKEYQDLRGKDV